jgi:hypothetical protein
VNTSATLLTAQDDAALVWLDPPQFSTLLSSQE